MGTGIKLEAGGQGENWRLGDRTKTGGWATGLKLEAGEQGENRRLGGQE